MKPKFVSKYPDLLEPNTPLIFADGASVYEALSKNYIRHKAGFFILAPSGAGKTYFISNQKEPHWIDGDDIWAAAKAHPAGEWWTEPIPVIDEIDQRSDVVTVEAKKLGFWIMGASNNWLKPDIVVIPDWETHKRYISMRENTDYDGGLTTEKLGQVKSSREWMLRWEKEGVPIIQSIEEAVKYLVEKYNKH